MDTTVAQSEQPRMKPHQNSAETLFEKTQLWEVEIQIVVARTM